MEKTNGILCITGWGMIRNGRVLLKDREDDSSENFINFADFVKSLYRKELISYPKFYKMDGLSKLGLLCAELVLKNSRVTETYSREEIGVVIANSSSSLDTDIEYQETINDRANYFPSPSVFVYTLPNILVGEICIRHRINGENAFFVSRKFDAEQLGEVVGEMMGSGRTKAVLCGWVDKMGEDYSSVLFLIEKEKKDGNCLPFTAENMNIIFNK